MDDESRVEASLAAARAWLAEEPDPVSAPALAELIARAESGDASARAELDDAFSGPLRFGTAGLRGALGPGSNRMNRPVVMRAAAGLAAHLKASGGSTIVIGYDARHRSSEFARDTARVMAGAGITPLLLPRALPTPVTAFAIGHLGADAGVMVTASHNPARDNGYKVYLGDGRQIAPPDDARIAAAMSVIGPLARIPLSDDIVVLDDTIVDAYVARAASLLEPGPREIAVAYTPLHGVGGELFLRCLTRAGFPDPVVVTEQGEPDADFPTVAFPNPEEAGALDLVTALAHRSGADLVVAHDPDADRVAIAVAEGDTYRHLTGDEVGAILGWWILQRSRPGSARRAGTMASSIVSGTLLRAIAVDAGIDFVETLTGFKWISRVPGLVFGYEEALGYCVDPMAVADKDGITAALFLLDLAARQRAAGSDLLAVLDDIERCHGVHATQQVSLRVPSAAVAREIVDRIRDRVPERIGGREVLAVDDLSEGADGLPPTPGMVLRLHGARMVVRPSGTESKVKCYAEIVVPADRSRRDLDAARTEAAAALDTVIVAMREILTEVIDDTTPA